MKLEIGGNSQFLDILCNSAQVLLDLLAGLCPLLDSYTGYCSSSQFVAHFFEYSMKRIVGDHGNVVAIIFFFF